MASSKSITSATRAPASPSGPEPLTGIADTLRAATRTEHDRIELALTWEARVSHHDGYADWLARLHAFYAVWEPALAAAIGDASFFDERRKLPLLARDLVALGRPAHQSTSAPLYPFTARAEALGALYVLEGSTLGGQLIAAQVHTTLGFAPAFHGSYGKQTAAYWRRFRAYLDANVAPDDFDRTIVAANLTFASLRRVLDDGHGGSIEL